MSILVVDDSRVMRQIVVRALRQAGFGDHQVVEASDGREGLAAVRTHQPDVVLTDWNMPGMSGLELVESLRLGGNSVPVGFVTSEGSAEMIGKAEAAGAAFVITKPFTSEEVREHLQQILG